MADLFHYIFGVYEYKITSVIVLILRVLNIKLKKKYLSGTLITSDLALNFYCSLATIMHLYLGYRREDSTTLLDIKLGGKNLNLFNTPNHPS